MKNKDLEALTIYAPGACKDCGSRDWSSCNLDETGEAMECSECHEWDALAQKLKRKGTPGVIKQ